MQGRAVLGLQSPRAVIRSAHQQDRDRTLHALRRKDQDMQLLPVAHRDHLLAQLEVVVDVGKPGRRDHGLVSLICWAATVATCVLPPGRQSPYRPSSPSSRCRLFLILKQPHRDGHGCDGTGLTCDELGTMWTKP